jgi:hypothetical protein
MVDSASPAGQAWLAVRYGNWPGRIRGRAPLLAGIGIVLALRGIRRGAGWLPLLLPAVSYYVTFIAVIGYTYDRFMLPIAVVLASSPDWRSTDLAVRAPRDGGQ